MGSRPLTLDTAARADRRVQVAGRPLSADRLLWAAAIAVVGVALFLVYERLSATAPVTADSANAVLQGRAMAGGNLLLHGWTLSGASFIATDLPFYGLIAAVRGVSPAVAHDAGAAIYTLLVLSACFLARGRARGSQALVRMGIALILLVAPAPGAVAQLMLLGPFHVGTTLFLVLALLLVDQAPDRLHRIVAIWALLTLAVLSDTLALYVGVIPLVIVCALRLPRRRLAAWAGWPEGGVLAAALLAPPAAAALEWTLQGLGGFTTVPLQAAFSQLEDLPTNMQLTVEGIFLVFGADFFREPVGADTLATLVRWIGLVFVAAVWWRSVRSWRRGEHLDLISQVLVVGMAVDVAAYLFSNQAIDLRTSRYLVPLLVFGAVLAARRGAGWLWDGHLRVPALAAGMAYAGVLAVSLQTPPAVNSEAAVGDFLQKQHLTSGVSGYWEASTVTVATGGRVHVRAIDVRNDGAHPYRWEAEDSWYDSTAPGNDARFVLRDTSGLQPLRRQLTVAAFGPPSREYRVGRYEVLVWDRNLMEDLRG